VCVIVKPSVIVIYLTYAGREISHVSTLFARISANAGNFFPQKLGRIMDSLMKLGRDENHLS
jgi:hypothetical protein